MTVLKKPACPENESERLHSLRALGLLDTPPEERFDRITRMAKRVFGVPIVLVSLVDANRQWFKSCIGLPVLETSRDISFCGHAILGDDVFVIPDAREDERFSDNPLVREEPHIRFYAGCPINGPDGHRLGTLCLIDRHPRILTAEDIDFLRDLASLVERELAAVELATTDELTNLANRRGFMLLADHSLTFCSRRKKTASLVCFDLDNFKYINDAFGHAEGDAALMIFADTMSAVFRESDLLGRLGGDEFAVLLNDATKEHAESVVARFRKTLDEFNNQPFKNYSVRFSYGVVEVDPAKHQATKMLLAEGDQLMYQHKRRRCSDAR